jgi:hypothetical protein
MVKVVEVKAIASDKEFAKHEGEFFEATHDFRIFNEDTDIYGINTDEDVADGLPRRVLIAKLRKGVFPKEAVQTGWDAFRLLAIPSRNRGAAAGPIDLKGMYWSRRKPVQTHKWGTRYMQNGKVSKMVVNNVVASGVIGYYEKTPFLKQPCRLTGYTRRGLRQFLHGIPYLQAIDQQFKRLVPDAHAKQLAAVRKKPMYQIADTAFSTLTINMNFRTALHKDAGDYREGFGNLSVIEWGRYHGGETLFPRFRAGINLRTGDFVAMNVHEFHCNAKIYETAEDKAYNRALPDIRTRDAKTGVVGSQELFQRISFVCYFREKIEDCIEKDTKDYYERIDFNLKDEERMAKAATLPSLPIPDRTGTLAEAQAALKGSSTLKQRNTRRAKAARRKTQKLGGRGARGLSVTDGEEDVISHE